MILDLEIAIDSKGSTCDQTFDQTPSVQWIMQGGHAQFWLKNIEFVKQVKKRTNKCFTCSCWCPVHAFAGQMPANVFRDAEIWPPIFSEAYHQNLPA